MSIMTSPALRYPKSLWSYNPIPGGCVLYLPFWNPGLRGTKFKSIDPFGHTCTPTTAPQGPTGRIFDGADSLITVPKGAPLDNLFDGGGTKAWWVYTDSIGETAGYLYSKGANAAWVDAEAAGELKLSLFISFSGDDGYWITSATEVIIDAWSHIVMTYNSDSAANDPIMYVNGISVTVGASTPTGTRDTEAASDLILGNTSIASRTWDGIFGEHSGYNRILSASEVSSLYNNSYPRRFQ